MDSLLCDELLIEIFHRLLAPPPPRPSSSSSLHHVSLVSKRWLRLSRLSTTSLSLTLVSPHHLSSSFLSCYPFLSSLSLTYSPGDTDTSSSSSSSSSSPSFDVLILTVAALLPSNLHHLLFHGVPISPASLSHLCSSPRYSFRVNLQSLAVVLPRPLNFSTWLPHLPSLKTLTITASDDDPRFHPWAAAAAAVEEELQTNNNRVSLLLLPIETLTLSGITRGDAGMGWLWRSCRGGLRRLRMSFCEGVGVDPGEWFPECLRGVEELELKASRPAAEKVFAHLAGNCGRLRSLLVHDGGGSREALLDLFLGCNWDHHLRTIDLRLPLDLENQHLLVMASRFRNLRSVSLQSCVLSTGDGLKALITSLSATLDDLSLINCDLVHKVPGLLTTLGQSLRHLKRLDLSQNEPLSDKELVSMLASCASLVELKLRGCGRLTTASVAFLPRTCKLLESLDLTCCRGIQGEDVVDILVSNLGRLRRVEIEGCKVSDSGWSLAQASWVEVVVVVA